MLSTLLRQSPFLTPSSVELPFLRPVVIHSKALQTRVVCVASYAEAEQTFFLDWTKAVASTRWRLAAGGWRLAVGPRLDTAELIYIALRKGLRIETSRPTGPEPNQPPFTPFNLYRRYIHTPRIPIDP